MNTSALVGVEALGLLGRALAEGSVIRTPSQVEGLLYARMPTGVELLFMFPPLTSQGEIRAVGYPTSSTPLTYWDGIALTLIKELVNPPPEPKLADQHDPYPIFTDPLRQTWRIEPHTGYILAGTVDPKSATPQIEQIDKLLEAVWHTTTSF